MNTVLTWPGEHTGSRLEVAMGCVAVGCAPEVIYSVGLGSCVAVTLYDPYRRIGGLAHVMLPDSAVVLAKGTAIEFPYRFADTAIQALLEDMKNHGAGRQDLVAKLAGGAKMFRSGENDLEGIGKRIVDRLTSILLGQHVPLVGWDIEGSCGRCVEFHLDSGDLVVVATGHEKAII